MTFFLLKRQSKSHTSVALTRLDERIARSPVGPGWLERQNFADACASLWIDGELVRLEDLVLHDAFRDTRTPTHELTIARDVLRTRRRISAQSPGWVLSGDGIRTLRQTSDINPVGAEPAEPIVVMRAAVPNEREGEGMTPTTHKISPASTMQLSMRCSRALTPRSNEPKSPAGLRPIRWSMISIGTRTRGWKSGAACSGKLNICRRCCRPSSPSMPGTSFPCCSTRPGSAGCRPRRSFGRQVLPPVPISPPSTVASKRFSSIGAGIATGKPGCLPSLMVCWQPPISA
ncbi:hypothetical protein AGR7A_pAt10065 [Agrobacterium deltaense NCPPB 1641]|uniref:Uncharacterized protein n=1 Tax=Agrobacterium deltaense NCPPB 1641 TaxID=1183425 RepID=A0A1S7U792_9HYPH|nr:hypothetical protein AGR7A_pAt10065 [Agrobacterium deltaense NCPPB 1641]